MRVLIKWTGLIAVVLSLTLITACAGVTEPVNNHARPSGLVAADWDDFDQAWVRPGFDADQFQAVLIEPAEIEFDPDWGRSDQRTGSRLAKSAADEDGTRQEMIAVVDQAIRQAIDRDDRFVIVDAPGPGVITLRPRIDDLFITAIDPMKMASRTDQYVRSVGYGRPGLQAVDASTDEVLMQVSDQRETRRYLELRLATPGLIATDFTDWYRSFTHDALQHFQNK